MLRLGKFSFVFITLLCGQTLAQTSGMVRIGVMNDMAGVWSHPQLKARDRWRSIPTPSGALQALLPPAQHSSFEYRMDAVPAVGEHTDAILRELGLAR